MIDYILKLKSLYSKIVSNSDIDNSDLIGFDKLNLYEFIKENKQERLPVNSFKDFLNFVYQKGGMELEYIPYLLKLYDEVQNSKSETFIFKKPAQIGASTFFTTLFTYYFLKFKLPILYVSTDSGKIKLIKNQLDIFLKNLGIEVLIKDYDFMLTSEGIIFFAYATSPKTFRSKPAAFVFIDEAAGMPSNIGGEGDVISLSLARTTTFSNLRKIFVFSTPSLDISFLEKYYKLAGRVKEFNLRCHNCKHLFIPSMKDVSEEDISIICPNCKCNIEILQASKLGEWRDTSNDGDNDILAFRMNLLCSALAKLKDIITRWKHAQHDVFLMRSFLNLVMAQEFSVTSDQFPLPPLGTFEIDEETDLLYSADVHKNDIHVLEVYHKNGFVYLKDGFIFTHAEFLNWLKDKNKVVIDIGFLSNLEVQEIEENIKRKLIYVRGSNNNNMMGKYVQYSKKRGGNFFFIYRQDVISLLYKKCIDNRLIVNADGSEVFKKQFFTGLSKFSLSVAKISGAYRWGIPEEFHEYSHFVDCLIYNIAIYETFKNNLDFTISLKKIKDKNIENKGVMRKNGFVGVY